MAVELRWKPNLSATCLNAAACRLAGRAAVDGELDAALAPGVESLGAALVDAGWPLEPAVEMLLALAPEYDNNRELATRCAARLYPHGGAAAAGIGLVAGAVADLEAALLRVRPGVVEELALRVGPIRQQWEARGPGMLAEAARLTDAAVVPASAEVALAAPYAGGGGWAHVAQNRVTLEAVLVNPHPELPEAVRLAWLLCQLNGDLPRFAEALPARGAGHAFALAMLPATLAGAAHVELVRPVDAELLARAVEAWALTAGVAPADVAERLARWWSAWLDGASADWGVAVAALAEMTASAA